MKNKIATIGIIIATLILAGVAVFTAVRLYQLRQQAVAPTAPTSKPKAQEVPIACTLLTFTLGATPTPTPTATPIIGTCQPESGLFWCSNHGGIALTVDHDVTKWSECLSWCKENMTVANPLCQYNADGPRNCWVNKPPSGGINSCVWVKGTPPFGSCYQAGSPTVTPTPTTTGVPNSCNGTCGSDSNCLSGYYFCYNGHCRDRSCPDREDCTCPGISTATLKPTATLIAGATPAGEAALPSAGISFPTIFGVGLGTLLLIGALILAL